MPMRRMANARRWWMLAFLAITFCALSPRAALAAWWDGQWQYRMKIDVDTTPKGAGIGDAIGRTQVLVRLHDGNFKFDTAKADGSDLRFVAADNKTPLHFHIEKWDPLVDQVGLVWVDLPAIAPGSVTSFYVYWGNDKANAAEDAAATYDADQLLVWHFADPTGAPRDATAYHNDGQTPVRRDDAGLIGLGAKLDGQLPIKLAANPTLNIAAAQPYTWQIWAKPAPANQTSVLFDQRDAGGVADLQIGLAAGEPYAQTTPAAGAALRVQAASPVTPDLWHLITVTASDKIVIYVDGTKVAEAPGSLPPISGTALLGGAAVAPPPSPTASTSSGVAPAATPAPGFVGEVDELEISKTVRPPGTIEVAVHGQGPQANLLGFEAPEQTSSWSTGYIGIILSNVTLDAWVIIGILILMMVSSWFVMVSKARQIGRTAKANLRFRAAMHEAMRGPHAHEPMPPVPPKAMPSVRPASLFHIYDIGRRELDERLSGGRVKADGTISARSLEAIRASMNAQLTREAAKLNNLMVLLTIAISGGPFVGLLGTVVGVMITFAAVAAAGDVNVNSIAPGISAALLATATGMFVAIPALFGYNYLQTRIKTMTNEMIVFVDEVVTRVAEACVQAAVAKAAE